jgi:hypothetical protein
MTGMDDWLSETNVEGTSFEPIGYARWIEAQRVGCWFWSDWETAMAYQDLIAFHMERAGPFLIPLSVD